MYDMKPQSAKQVKRMLSEHLLISKIFTWPITKTSAVRTNMKVIKGTLNQFQFNVNQLEYILVLFTPTLSLAQLRSAMYGFSISALTQAFTHTILRAESIMLTQGYIGLTLMCVHVSGGIVLLLLCYLCEPCCWICS